MIIKDLGAVTAYAAAVEKGYTGTEEEFATLMASYATVAEEAAESAESASTSATSASASAQTATTKAGEASTSATQASASATSASQSASTATTKASEASASASTAGTKASEASASATTASTKASEASASATSAQTAQGLAESARDDAVDAKTDAESARDLAQQYAESIDPEKIYSAYPTDTASGSVASFADGADDIPMKSVVVNIEPAQDLHGQESPYPAGGGKNKFDGYTANWKKWQLNNNVFITRQDTDAGVTFTPNEDGTVTVVTTGTYMGIAVEIESSDADRVFSVSGATYVALYSAYEDGASRLNVSPTYATISAGVSGCIGIRFDAVGTYTIKCQLESGSTATDYAPYSNICPISGFTEAKVARTGVNVWDEEYQLGFYNARGVFVANTYGYFSSKNPIPVKPNSEYVLCIKGASNQTIYVPMYYRDGTFKTRLDYTLSGGVRIITVPEDVYFIGFSTEAFYGTTYNHDISINYPATDTDYHPYAGDTYSITFPSEAGTVYGGTLDVTNGTLTVDRAIIASYNGETLPSEWISDRDKYVAGTTPTTGAQVCYKLSQAVVYTLTPTEIKSLLGDNNIWADAGNTEVTYRADTAKYIDKKIAEVINALS